MDMDQVMQELVQYKQDETCIKHKAFSAHKANLKIYTWANECLEKALSESE